MTQRYDIYAIGNALVDTEVEVSDAFLERMGIGKGIMTLVDEARQRELVSALNSETRVHRRASGGSACNTAVAAQYFGARAFYACRVADDDTGHFFVDDLHAAGVDTNMAGDKSAGVSGKCLVMITPDAERTMNTFLGISETVGEEAVIEDQVAASRFAYIEGYLVTSPSARAAAIRLRETAKKAGVRTALTFSDPAMVQFFADGLREMIGDGVDILFCNEAEALGFSGTDNIDAAIDILRTHANALVITRGAQGARLWDGDRIIDVEPFPVKAVDSNGAGDMFAGAFLYALSQSHDFATAGRLASAAAARVVSDFGPRLPAAEHLAIRRDILGH
ncbi:adenosine kinase [Alcanivorax sp. 1008]|uniref:adenosine kinase n=1 Tax=Alcanivorax sp. 1008 TaxID=2816853 RepID=UPI001DAAD9CE|nr:adenosine kinase [Alcanivorax sp. 1008]MCC1497877.1 adenosine kinase [Alcanivorax sp. 1008]